MTNPQALTAAAKAAGDAYETAGCTGDLRVKRPPQDTLDAMAQACITAYLNALPPISEGIVDDVARAMFSVDFKALEWAHDTHREVRERYRLYARAAADTIQHLSAKLAEQGAS